MDGITQTWSGTDELQLTLDAHDCELDQRLQQDACKGICQDIILMGQCDPDGGPQLPVWPLVVVDREAPTKEPEVEKTPKRASWMGRRKPSKVPAVSPTIEPGSVDLIFVEEDKDSFFQAIEVCPSPSRKISDLQALKRATQIA
jgi:hypothetical protein